MNPNYEYNVYISSPGLNYPTYSLLFTVPFLTIQQQNTVFVRFSAENYIKIRNRGPLDSKTYCNVKSNHDETVKCAKACFLAAFNVSMRVVSLMLYAVNKKLYILKLYVMI